MSVKGAETWDWMHQGPRMGGSRHYDSPVISLSVSLPICMWFVHMHAYTHVATRAVESAEHHLLHKSLVYPASSHADQLNRAQSPSMRALVSGVIHHSVRGNFNCFWRLFFFPCYMPSLFSGGCLDPAVGPVERKRCRVKLASASQGLYSPE